MRVLNVSFSGGETSGTMTDKVLAHWQDRYDEFHITFANTAQEHKKTLDYVDACDHYWRKRYGVGVVYLEAVVNPTWGIGIGHRVVSYKTASRDGSPFAASIAKEGITNAATPKCSDRLKLAPMISYRKEMGISKCDTAIGIRIDEIDRIHKDRERLRLLYPLVSDFPMTKAQVHRYWQNMPFRLDLPSHHSNCLWCWKKSYRKLLTNLVEHPEWFEFPDKMEKTYGHIKCTDTVFTDGTRKVFFRGEKSVQDLIEMAKYPFQKYVDDQDGVYTPDMFHDELDKPGGQGCDGEECVPDWGLLAEEAA